MARTVDQANEPQFRVEVESLGREGADAARRDPRTIGVGSTMDIVLIAPLASPENGDDPSGTTWGVATTGAETSAVSGKGVSVAVLDTGIDRQHAAFDGVEIEERDFTGQGNGDGNGHGLIVRRFSVEPSGVHALA